ncbi:MAG: hypothetical protein EA001_12100, partial [Oscillatoriales cyanobacterium]
MLDRAINPAIAPDRAGGVVIAQDEAETIDFPCPNGRNKGLRACHQMPLMADETVMFRAPVVVTRG